ncbi:MAG: calcium/proton exchanger [Gemmatimonadales bacterium]
MFLLLVFVPVALVLDFGVHASPAWIFATSAVAVVPLAGLLGQATEQLEQHVGPGLGGLLNATFGNAAELIIAAMALREGLYELVKASLTGSIIGNVLFVFGLSALLGGLKFKTLKFNPIAASQSASLLLLSAIGLVIPAIFHIVSSGRVEAAEQTLSLIIASVLIVTYVLSLVFSLRTHRHLYTGSGTPPEERSTTPWSLRKAIGVLLVAAGLIGLMSELLVGSADQAAESLGMSHIFVGVILLAIIGNAAEHSTAVMVAMKNKMDLSINVALGSSLQIALFVAPLLVFLSYVLGPAPMDLRFSPMEVLAVAMSVGVIAAIAQDGETHWMEGVLLIAVYFVLATAFFFLPA